MAGPASHIVFLQQPGASAGSVIDAGLSPAGVRVARRRFGQHRHHQQIDSDSDPGRRTARNATPRQISQQVVNGISTFTDLSIDIAATGYADRAAGTLPAMTSAIHRERGRRVAARVRPTTGQPSRAGHQPGNDRCGGGQVRQHRHRRYINVTVSIHSGPGVFTANSTTQVAAVDGIASSTISFSTLRRYSLSFIDETLTSPISLTFQVDAAAPSKLVFGQQPTNSTAGAHMTPGLTVTVTDAFGNLVTSVAATLKVAIQSGPGGFDSGSTTQATPINGVATFANLILDAAGSYTLRVTAGALTAGTSAAFVVHAASPGQLVFGQQPKDSTAGTAISPVVSVLVEDRFGNLVTDSSAAVTIALHSGPSASDGASITQATAAGGWPFQQTHSR